MANHDAILACPLSFRRQLSHDGLEDTLPRLVRLYNLLRFCLACADLASEEKDLIIIGGGVAGYVAAIKAGQEGMKVSQ